MTDLENKIENYNKLHRLDMIEKCLSTISLYANNVIEEIRNDFDYEENVNEEEIEKIVTRIKNDLELCLAIRTFVFIF